MLQTPEEVKLSLMGIWFRMNDKLQRVQNIVNRIIENGFTRMNFLEDSYLDVSNYGIISNVNR